MSQPNKPLFTEELAEKLQERKDSDIPAILDRIDSGHLHGVIAMDYGVSLSCINNIAIGRNWQSVVSNHRQAAAIKQLKGEGS